MKNTRKLIPAFAMLLVAAVMMSTASFAWFTMNSTVTATGMQVTAVAPDSIWISQDGSAWSSTTTLAYQGPTEGAKVPTAYIPSKVNKNDKFDGWTFQMLSQEASALVLKNGGLPIVDGSTIKTGVNADGNVVVDGKELEVDGKKVPAYVDSTSFYRDVFYIMVDADATKDVKVYVNASVSYDKEDLKATTEGEDDRTKIDDIYKALRIAIVAKDGTSSVILEPTLATDDGTIEYAALAPNVTSNELVTLAGGVSTEVAVYAWIEGNDEDCKNANALNTDDFDITLYFSIAADAKLPAQSGT